MSEFIDGYTAAKIKEFWGNPTFVFGRNDSVQLLNELDRLRKEKEELEKRAKAAESIAKEIFHDENCTDNLFVTKGRCFCDDVRAEIERRMKGKESD